MENFTTLGTVNGIMFRAMHKDGVLVRYMAEELDGSDLCKEDAKRFGERLGIVAEWRESEFLRPVCYGA